MGILSKGDVKKYYEGLQHLADEGELDRESEVEVEMALRENRPPGHFGPGRCGLMSAVYAMRNRHMERRRFQTREPLKLRGVPRDVVSRARRPFDEPRRKNLIEAWQAFMGRDLTPQEQDELLTATAASCARLDQAFETPAVVARLLRERIRQLRQAGAFQGHDPLKRHLQRLEDLVLENLDRFEV